MILVAVVTADDPLEVLTDGAVTPVPAVSLDHYSPSTNDRVLVAVSGATAFVLGALAEVGS